MFEKNNTLIFSLISSVIIFTIIFSSAFSNQYSHNVYSQTDRSNFSDYQKIIKSNNSINNEMKKSAKVVYEGEGKITSQRVLNFEDDENGISKIEISYSGKGYFTDKNINVTESWTFINTHRPNGVIQGIGDGSIFFFGEKINNDSKKIVEEIATMKGYGRGFIDVDGKISYPTAQLYSVADVTGKLAFLNEIVGTAFWEVDDLGNYNYKLWILE